VQQTFLLEILAGKDIVERFWSDFQNRFVAQPVFCSAT
jgi:hypothetical protein